MVRGVPEIERKFKVEALPDDLLGPGSSIRQGYLSVEPVEIREVAAETKAFLIERGIEVGGEQETKTRKALEFFSARLREESSG